MAKKRYYGIYAENGIGIYYDWDRVRYAQQYMRGERIKGFQHRDEAEKFACEGFDALHGEGSAMRTMIDGRNYKLNFFYYLR